MNNNRLSRTLFLIGIMGFLANGDVYSAAPLLVSIANDLHISPGNAALSITAYMLSFGLFTILLGPLGDRFGKARMLIIASFGTAVCSCLSIYTFNLNSLILLRFANGAFAAGIMPVSMALLGDLVERSKRQSAVAKLMGMMTLGGASATFIGGIISYIGSWRTVYFAYGIAEMITAFLLLAYLDRNEGVINKTNFFKGYIHTLNNKHLLSYLSIFILIGFCVFGSFTFTGQLLKESTNYSIMIIGIILSVFGIGGLIGSKVASRLRSKIGNGICAVSGLIGFLSFNIIAFTGFLPLWILAFFGLGISFILIHSTMITVSQSTAPSMRGTIMSFVSFCMFIGSSIGTVVNKRILADYGIQAIFSASSVIFLVLNILAFTVLYLSRKSGRQALNG